jgi:hypothetical protein
MPRRWWRKSLVETVLVAFDVSRHARREWTSERAFILPSLAPDLTAGHGQNVLPKPQCRGGALPLRQPSVLAHDMGFGFRVSNGAKQCNAKCLSKSR